MDRWRQSSFTHAGPRLRNSTVAFTVRPGAPFTRVPVTAKSALFAKMNSSSPNGFGSGAPCGSLFSFSSGPSPLTALASPRSSARLAAVSGSAVA